MLIDWFTVGAQVLNFLILVWLLKHFLYKPILNAIDSREKQIAAELADANVKNTEAKKSATTFKTRTKHSVSSAAPSSARQRTRRKLSASASSTKREKRPLACAPRKRPHCEMTRKGWAVRSPA